ncbi:hypothetical protein QV08_04320 [Gallibacterium salpingitidis]|uniref:4-hydroxy-2-oxoheptanedioate aldolase n=1 Tax=Gallibacterium salpingitidis TaxID=505341 RepID=UPI000805B008|nr:4-hydroxy-2-oxoheptanedioate aldolase [Gallibacterium salpingitidis]OBX08437.1 hypothetical protein QV08_04320 [Gallibacterium salpingitidis]
MKLPENRFKAAIKQQQAQIGLWIGMANGYACEIAANAGFDWLLLDGEHAPNDIQTLLHQLQVVSGYPDSSAIVRPPIGNPVIIKQLLDIGAQTLLIPMVETVEQAEKFVRAVRYPPKGIRGVGSALARASRWNNVTNYLHQADQEICLLLQIETQKGLQNLSEIVKVDGVDGIFIGPADLSASLGHLGNPAHPEVQQKIEESIQIIRQAGKAPGILYADAKMAQHYLDLGCLFVAVGVDTSILMRELVKLANSFKQNTTTMMNANQNSVY